MNKERQAFHKVSRFLHTVLTKPTQIISNWEIDSQTVRQPWAVYERRFRFLHNLLADATRIMSNWEVHGIENISNQEGPVCVCAPHYSAIDLTEILTLTGQHMVPVYKRQEPGTPGYLGTRLAEHIGGIETPKGNVNDQENIDDNNSSKKIALSNYRKFQDEIFKAWDKNRWVFIHPEGDKNHRQPMVSKPIFDLTKFIRRYEMRNEAIGIIRPEVAIVPIGLEYIEPTIQVPGWRLTTPFPFATKTIFRFCEPIYLSEHQDWTMDSCMRLLAKLSNRPYAPDIEKNRTTGDAISQDN